MSHNDQNETKNEKNEQKTKALEINYSYTVHTYSILINRIGN